jgi:hypothetical protein
MLGDSDALSSASVDSLADMINSFFDGWLVGWVDVVAKFKIQKIFAGDHSMVSSRKYSLKAPSTIQLIQLTLYNNGL